MSNSRKIWREKTVKIELSGGNWAEIRDKLKGKDKFSVQRSVTFDVDSGKAKQAVSADLMTTMVNALLTTVIESWSPELGPIPSQTPDPAEALGELDIDDYNALEAAVRPLLDKVLQTPNRETSSA